MGASEKFPTATALVMARTLKRVAVKFAGLGLGLGLARRANSLHKEALSALRKRQFSVGNSPTMKTRGQETSTTPTIDPKSLKDRARLPTPSEMDATSIGALNADATVLDAAIQQARIDSVLRPVQRLAPGILDWARARVLRALHGGATFTSISQAQEWLDHEIAQNFCNPKVGYTFEIRRVLADLLGGIVLSRLHRALYRGNEGEKPAPRPLTSRTSATPAPDSQSDRVRLPTPSELDDWPGLDEALEELLAEKRAKEAAKKGKYPTAMALVMARTMKRIAVKYADLALARRANSLEKEALSALQKRQSALSNPREINSGEGTSTTKSEKRVIAGPSKIDGGVSRIVEFADGAGRIESWKPGVGWVGGGASADEFIGAAPVSSLLARRLGIPLSER
jgi:hypothetical protein